MNATTSLHHYRGHPVVITKTTSHAGDYYTQTNETVAAMMADLATDDDKTRNAKDGTSDDATVYLHAYATEAGAKAAAAAEIEDAIGSAEAYEIEEALTDILASATAEDRQKLRDALDSYRADNTHSTTGDQSDASHRALTGALYKAATRIL